MASSLLPIVSSCTCSRKHTKRLHVLSYVFHRVLIPHSMWPFYGCVISILDCVMCRLFSMVSQVRSYSCCICSPFWESCFGLHLLCTCFPTLIVVKHPSGGFYCGLSEGRRVAVLRLWLPIKVPILLARTHGTWIRSTAACKLQDMAHFSSDRVRSLLDSRLSQRFGGPSRLHGCVCVGVCVCDEADVRVATWLSFGWRCGLSLFGFYSRHNYWGSK